MRKRLFTGDNLAVADGMNNLASVLNALGKPDEAEPLHRDALAMRKRLFRDDHLALVVSLSNLAVVLQARGKRAEAEPLLRDALRMATRLVAAYAGRASEGEALSLLAATPLYRDAYLSNALAPEGRSRNYLRRGVVEQGGRHPRLRAPAPRRPRRHRPSNRDPAGRPVERPASARRSAPVPAPRRLEDRGTSGTPPSRLWRTRSPDSTANCAPCFRPPGGSRSWPSRHPPSSARSYPRTPRWWTSSTSVGSSSSRLPGPAC